MYICIFKVLRNDFSSHVYVLSNVIRLLRFARNFESNGPDPIWAVGIYKWNRTPARHEGIWESVLGGSEKWGSSSWRLCHSGNIARYPRNRRQSALHRQSRNFGEETSWYQSPESDLDPGPPTVNDANSTHSTAKFGRFKWCDEQTSPPNQRPICWRQQPSRQTTRSYQTRVRPIIFLIYDHVGPHSGFAWWQG
jgi:hypothetical protein